MALNKVTSLNVYYKDSSREVSLYGGSVNQISAQDEIGTLAIVVKDGHYSEDASDVLKCLSQLGIDVPVLISTAEFDYRNDRGMGVLVSSPLENAPFQRLAILEAESELDATSKLPYLFAGIEKALGESDTNRVYFVLPDCFESMSPSLALRNLFYASVHWCAIDSIFKTIGVIVPEGDLVLYTDFANCMVAYNHIDKLEFDGYLTYAQQAQSVVDRVKASDIETNLTDRQMFGLAMYTTDFAFTLNSIIRSNNVSSSEYVNAMPIIEAIDSALMNLDPPFSAAVYRAEGPLSEARKVENQPGNEVMNSAYTSTTWNQTLPFLHSMPDYPTTFCFLPVYTKDSFDARYFRLVETYSYHPEEDEVLAIRNMKYKVDFAFEDTEEFTRYNVIGTEVPMPRR